MTKELQAAIKYYADTYISLVVGTDIADGISAAENIAEEYKYRWVSQGFGAYDDSYVADYVYAEANALEC